MALNQIVTSFIASEAITEFAIVSLDAAGKVVITDLATDAAAVGVAQRACNAGDSVDVVVHGLTKVIASESITFVTTPILSANTDGKVQATDTAGQYPLCRVISNTNQTSASAGEQLLVLFTGPSIVYA